jgi:hypothetical protein
VSAEVHGSSQLAEQPPLRLPRDAIGEAALDLKTFLPLHPGIDGGKHIARSSGNGSRRRGESGAGNLRDEPVFFRDIDPGSFFRQRLVDGGGIEPDLVSYVEELAFADEIAGIRERAGSLELRRPGKNPLECLSVERGARTSRRPCRIISA